MKRAKKILIWLLIVIAIIGGIVWKIKTKKAITIYTTAQVVRGNLTQTVSVTGEINPETQFDLAFKTNGILAKIANVGDQVSSGQEIASLDKDSLKLQLQQAQKDIQYQQKTLASMKKNDDVYNKDQRDAQKALIEKALLSQSISKQNISDASLYAPVNGIISKTDFNVGEMVSTGQAAVSVITKDLVIDSKVPESDIVKLSLGQNAKITFDALTPNDIFDAQVVQIDPASTTIQDVVYYKIKLKLVSDDARIKPGMSANIDIKTAENDNVLSIPLRAVKDDNGSKYVDVLLADNTTKRVNVQAGLEGDEGMVEIKSGLSGGEKVVTFSQTK